MQGYYNKTLVCKWINPRYVIWVMVHCYDLYHNCINIKYVYGKICIACILVWLIKGVYCSIQAI